MIRSIAVTAVGLAALSTAALAAPPPYPGAGPNCGRTPPWGPIKLRDGKTQEVAIAPTTKFASVVKSNLGDVGDGKFIGTATKGEPPVALEVVIFPDSMKGTGEGHYDWDTIPDTTGDSAPVKSSMTNGTIKATGKPLGNSAMTKSSMTNGTVAAGSAASSGKKITVTYGDGKSLDIAVPPSAPIVAFAPADKAIVVPGAAVFANSLADGDKVTARFIAVGKDGVVPPM